MSEAVYDWPHETAKALLKWITRNVCEIFKINSQLLQVHTPSHGFTIPRYIICENGWNQQELIFGWNLAVFDTNMPIFWLPWQPKYEWKWKNSPGSRHPTSPGTSCVKLVEIGKTWFFGEILPFLSNKWPKMSEKWLKMAKNHITYPPCDNKCQVDQFQQVLISFDGFHYGFDRFQTLCFLGWGYRQGDPDCYF